MAFFQLRGAGRLAAPALLVLWLVAAFPARAQSPEAPGFAFLRLEPSARASALGGAYAALPTDDVNGLFYNPALLSERTHRALSVSYLNHLSDLSAGFFAYGRNTPLGAAAVGVRYLGWGALQGADASGAETESFGAADVALTAGLARSYGDRLRYGASVHYVHSRIEQYGASAVAADFGVLYYAEGPQIALSASVSNLGRVLDAYDAAKDDLPLDVRLGASKRLRHLPLLVTVAAYDLHEAGADSDAKAVGAALEHLVVGGEFQFSDAFQVRAGYNHRRHEALKTRDRLDVAGVSAGFGLRVSRVRFDYAYNAWSAVGGLHQVTLRARL